MSPDFDLHHGAGMDEAVDRFWDQASQGRSGSAGDLDAADAATIRRLHAFDDRPEPNPAFTRQLRENLMHARTIQVSSGPSGLPLPNSRASHPWRIGPQARPPLSRHWALTQLATAALLLLTMVGSFLAFGPGRRGQEPQDPAVIPAISGSPETPQTPEAGDAPIAEFLWQADGGGDFPLPEFPLEEPNEVAIDPQGNVWVADGSNARFVIFAPDGTFLEDWGTPGSGEGEFDFVCSSFGFGDVAFDAAGNIYVADSGNQRIQKFGPDRTFLTSWGSEGTADDQFICPAALTIDRQGRVYVSDQGWGRVKVFAGDGVWLATWSGIMSPRGIAVDDDGNIWVCDFGGSGAVVKFSADGERLSTWKGAGTGDMVFDGPKSIAVDAEGRVFVASYFANQVRIYSPEGTLLNAWGERGDAPGQFQAPRGIALDGQGAVYVAEGAGERIQKFRLLPPLGPEEVATPAS